MVKESFASHVGAHVGFRIYPDDLTDDIANTFSHSFPSLEIIGEVLLYGDKTFELDAFIVRHLSVDVLPGIFRMVHDIGVRSAKISMHGSKNVSYGPDQNMNYAIDS